MSSLSCQWETEIIAEYYLKFNMMQRSEGDKCEQDHKDCTNLQVNNEVMRCMGRHDKKYLLKIYI